jgi:hypothetical protein
VWFRHFDWNGTAFAQQGPKKIGNAPPPRTVAPMGQPYGAISISADGRTVLVGSNYDDQVLAGAAYLWGRGAAGYAADEWVQLGERLTYPALTQPALVGYSVALSGDASQVVVGGEPHGMTKHAW